MLKHDNLLGVVFGVDGDSDNQGARSRPSGGLIAFPWVIPVFVSFRSAVHSRLPTSCQLLEFRTVRRRQSPANVFVHSVFSRSKDSLPRDYVLEHGE